MRKLRARALTAAATTIGIATNSGCVTLPTSGSVNMKGLPGSGGSDQVVQLEPRPPGVGWSPVDVVMGFLAATGSSLSGSSPGRAALSGNSLAVARDYLTRRLRPYWQPALSSPTVIDSSLAGLAITWHGVPARVNSGPPVAVVEVTSDRVETLQSTGNIVVSTKKQVFQFGLIESQAGQWRIETLPSHSLLLLTQPDFRRDYQPRNLYFFAGSFPSHVLVPYPVFIPEAATQEAAQALATDLLLSGQGGTGPVGWLSEATSTAFPPGAKITSVDVTGIKAVVNLDLPASKSLSDAQIDQIEAQLVWTLTSAPYPGGNPDIGSVQLVVHHGPSEFLLPQKFASWLPTPGAGQLY